MSSLFDAELTQVIDRNIEYPKQIWYGLAIFLFVVGCFQWGSSLHSKFAKYQQQESDEESTSNNHIHYKFSLRRIPFAFINIYRVVAFRWTLEIGQTYTLNIAEIFVTLGYIALLYTYTFINTTSLDGQKVDILYWSSRAARVAASQIPLVAALGTKNNIVSLVTGISYDKLNYIHRMMARTCFTLLCVHGASEASSYPYFRLSLNDQWLRSGMTAIAALFALIIVSLRPIRQEAYEVFFYTHFISVLIFLVGAYHHTAEYNASFWIWPSIVIWGLDRFIRMVRLVVFNHSYFGFKSGSGTMDGTTELLSENLVRLRLSRPPHFHWSPGQTAYLIMPSVSTLPFEAHPFTIASFDSSLIQTTVPEDQSNSDMSSNPLWKELVFLINVQEGFTKKLKKVAARKGQVKVFVDGPYGPSPDLGCFDTSVLVAGGSGVSYTLPVLLNVIERVRNGKSSCRRVVFIWSIRDATHVRWIEDALMKAVELAPRSLAISIRIFITGRLPTAESDSVPSSPIEKKDTEHIVTQSVSFSSLSLTPHDVKMENGRPNLGALLKEEASTTSGRMSVSVCGSQGIARAVRHALRFPLSGPSTIFNGGPSVTLHVESFGYA